MNAAFPKKNLGDVCAIIGGGTPSKDRPAFFQGHIPWATVRDLKNDVVRNTEYKITDEAVASSATKVIAAPSVIIATRVGLGKVCRIEQDTALNQDLRAIVPNNDKELDCQFLFWWLKSVAHEIVANGTGATVQGVKLPFIKGLQIPLPPLAEQKRIVALLDQAFEGIELALAAATKNLKNARELFETTLNATFTQKGEGWVETTLGEVCEFKNGLNFTKSSKGQDVQIVGVRDFQNNYWIPVDELASVQIDGELSKAYELKGGDILTVRSNGNKQLIGRSMLAPEISERTSHSGFTIRIRISCTDIEPSYLTHYLKSGLVRQKLIDSGEGANISSLNQKTLGSLPVKFPDRSEQLEIVEKIEDIAAQTQHLEALYQQKIDALNELKQSLLQKAFAGELTAEAQPLEATG